MSVPVFEYPAYAEWSRDWSDDHPTPLPWSCDVDDPKTEPIPVVRPEQQSFDEMSINIRIGMLLALVFMTIMIVIFVGHLR